MKIRDKKNIFLLTLMVLFIILYKIIIIPSFLQYGGIILSIFMIITSFLSIILLGYRKEKRSSKIKEIRFIIIYETVICFLIMYGLGFILGFLNNAYSLKLLKVIENLVNPFIFVITSEIIRNVVIKANKDKKIMVIAITVLLLLMEMFTSINSYDFTSFGGIFIFITMSLLPLITKHFMLSYVTYYTSIKECLLYRLVVDLYVYIVPIFSNLGDYLTCIINIIYPYIIYNSISKVITRRDAIKHEFKTKRLDAVDTLFICLIIFMALIITGNFGIQVISVGSDSMSSAINKGDAVIINLRYKDLNKNDIVSYDYKGKNTIHRIVKVEEIDGKIVYHTKGDANNTEDNNIVTKDMIKGKIMFRIPFIGYPSIWLNEYRS